MKMYQISGCLIKNPVVYFIRTVSGNTKEEAIKTFETKYNAKIRTIKEVL